MPVVVPERCPADHPCPLIEFCPVGAVVQNGLSAPVIDLERCVECGVCVRSCPQGAVRKAPGAEPPRLQA